jgi:hypothetical protein
MNSLQMGVFALFRSFFHLLSSPRNLKFSSGARPALSMGVAPEAIFKNMFRVKAQVNFPSFNHHIVARVIISSGAWPTLPMVVAPEAIVEYFWV